MYAPKFATFLPKSLIISNNQTFKYDLPDMEDEDKDLVTITLSSSSHDFFTINENTLIANNVPLGSYRLIITLIDDNKYPLSTNYTLDIKVIEPS